MERLSAKWTAPSAKKIEVGEDRRPRAIYYRVSVADEHGTYWVRRAGLTFEEAALAVLEETGKGRRAVMLPCDGKKRERSETWKEMR